MNRQPLYSKRELPISTRFVSVHRHAVWHQRIQSYNFVLAVSDNLCVGIASQKQVHHKRSTKHATCHFRVWHTMQHKIQRMVDYEGAVLRQLPTKFTHRNTPSSSVWQIVRLPVCRSCCRPWKSGGHCPPYCPWEHLSSEIIRSKFP